MLNAEASHCLSSEINKYYNYKKYQKLLITLPPSVIHSWILFTARHNNKKNKMWGKRFIDTEKAKFGKRGGLN